MNIKLKILLPLLALTAVSCSSIRKQTREGKDIKLTFENSNILNSCSSQYCKEAFTLNNLLTNSKEKYDSTLYKYNLCIQPIDKKHIRVNFLQDSSVISSTVLKGHYRNGYFNIRRWESKFIFGPLIWSLTDQLTCIGLSEENKLVVVYTSGGQLLLLFFPFMAAQSGDSVFEFQWAK